MVNSHKSTIEMQVDISEYQTEYLTYFSWIVWVDRGAISELPYYAQCSLVADYPVIPRITMRTLVVLGFDSW